MKILLVSATSGELKPSLEHWNWGPQSTTLVVGKHEVNVLIGGVGMVSTAFELGKHLAVHSYDLAINVGIAGSFDFDLQIGDVLHITDDVFADMGAEDGENFLSIDELGFGQAQIKPMVPPLNSPVLNAIPQAKAISVNRVHGHEMSIAKTLSRFKPQLESMEGAAFFYACNQYKLPSLQIRSISNYVERRKRESWNIPLAVRNLNDFLLQFLNDIA